MTRPQSYQQPKNILTATLWHWALVDGAALEISAKYLLAQGAEASVRPQQKNLQK
jgi:hypothetical protein